MTDRSADLFARLEERMRNWYALSNDLHVVPTEAFIADAFLLGIATAMRHPEWAACAVGLDDGGDAMFVLSRHDRVDILVHDMPLEATS